MYTWDGQLIKSLIIAIYTLSLFYILYSMYSIVLLSSLTVTQQLVIRIAYCSLRYSQYDFRTLH